MNPTEISGAEVPSIEGQAGRSVRTRRLLAGLIDAVIASLATLGVIRAHVPGFWIICGILTLIWTELGWQMRGSPGKVFLNLGVESKSRSAYYLRELIGKCLCVLTLGIGFVPALSSEGKGLHDYLAKSRVMRWNRGVSFVYSVRTAVSVLVLTVACVTLLDGKGIDEHLQSASVPSWSIKDVNPAVMKIDVFRGKSLYAQGSGFLIDKDGTSVTNVHVLSGGDRAEVTLGDGRKYQALSVQAFDLDQDIVVFKIGESSLDFPYLTLGTSRDIDIGDKITVISSPEGLNNTVSEGVLSGRRDGERSLIQISAPISPGSSGAPIFDKFGKVVGVAQSQMTRGQNLNFAIPAEEITRIRTSHSGQMSLNDLYNLLDGGAVEEATADNQEQPAQGAGISGSYFGAVRNTTADLGADAILVITDSNGTISGCFGVRTPLYGSGTVKGQSNYPDVSFQAKSEGMSIQFTGDAVGNQLVGTYLVQPTNGGATQSGIFKLVRESRKTLSRNYEDSCPTEAEFGH